LASGAATRLLLFTVSMTVNDRWRICFEFRKGDAHRVEIVDHRRGKKHSIAAHPGRLLKRELTDAG
jgi:hypothetical protein